MKVYVFFYSGDIPPTFDDFYSIYFRDSTREDSISTAHTFVYAITKDKYKRKVFKRSRSSDIFEERVYQMTDVEYDMLVSEYGYAELEWCKIDMILLDGKLRKTRLMLITEGEREVAVDNARSSFIRLLVENGVSIFGTVEKTLRLFSPKVIEDLITLSYSAVMEDVEQYVNGDFNDRLPFSCYNIDLFYLFENIFGFTFDHIEKGFIDESI